MRLDEPHCLQLIHTGAMSPKGGVFMCAITQIGVGSVCSEKILAPFPQNIVRGRDFPFYPDLSPDKKYNEIAIHGGPCHLDETFADLLLKFYGESIFPGISAAKVVRWPGNGTPNGRHAWEWMRRGTLPVGTGGFPPFDEHVIQSPGHCSASLIARALIDNDLDLAEGNFEKEIGGLLQFVLERDHQTGGPETKYDIANGAKVVYTGFGWEEGFRWTQMGLEAFLIQHGGFLAAAVEFKKNPPRIEAVRGHRGKKIKILAVRSDNTEMDKFARSGAGGKADILIQQRSSGNVMISAKRVTLHDVAKMIRLEEQKQNGRIMVYKWSELVGEGTVRGIPEWFYFKPRRLGGEKENNEKLFNGSLTHPDVRPTKIPLERILEIVKIAVSDTFEPARETECRKGICAGRNCPWYDFGLLRCGSIRAAATKPEIPTEISAK